MQKTDGSNSTILSNRLDLDGQINQKVYKILKQGERNFLGGFPEPYKQVGGMQKKLDGVAPMIIDPPLTSFTTFLEEDFI